MSYKDSALKFCHHLTWNHVWDCLVITDLSPIFLHLCSLALWSSYHEYWTLRSPPSGGPFFPPSFFLFFKHNHLALAHTLYKTFLCCQDKSLCPTVPANLKTLKKVLHNEVQSWNWTPLCAESSAVCAFKALTRLWCPTSSFFCPFQLLFGAKNCTFLSTGWLKIWKKKLITCCNTVAACGLISAMWSHFSTMDSTL